MIELNSCPFCGGKAIFSNPTKNWIKCKDCDFETPHFNDTEALVDKWNSLYNCKHFDSIIKKLAEYKDAEEQGLLLRLPCKVGDTVWFVGNNFINDYEVRKFIVGETGINFVQIAKEINGREYWDSFNICDIGKTIFLTRKEAEKALEQMKGGGVE